MSSADPERTLGQISLWPDNIPADPSAIVGGIRTLTVELNVGLDDIDEKSKDVFIVGSNFSQDPIFRLRLGPLEVKWLEDILVLARAEARRR